MTHTEIKTALKTARAAAFAAASLHDAVAFGDANELIEELERLEDELIANPCVSCCERVATTTSEGVEHPVCEPCAAEEARAIADYNQTSPR